MKKLRILLSVMALGLLMTFDACKENPPPPVPLSDQQLAKLSKGWKPISVTRSAVDETANYSNFVLTINGTAGQTTFGFTTTGRTPGTKTTPWPQSGTFTFGTDVATSMTRDDGVIFTYAVTDTQLQLSFTYNGAGYDARTNSINGNWVMTFGL